MAKTRRERRRHREKILRIAGEMLSQLEYRSYLSEIDQTYRYELTAGQYSIGMKITMEQKMSMSTAEFAWALASSMRKAVEALITRALEDRQVAIVQGTFSTLLAPGIQEAITHAVQNYQKQQQQQHKINKMMAHAVAYGSKPSWVLGPGNTVPIREPSLILDWIGVGDVWIPRNCPGFEELVAEAKART